MQPELEEKKERHLALTGNDASSTELKLVTAAVTYLFAELFKSGEKKTQTKKAKQVFKL